ncbi:CopY/TcrY family copper transport repressor [Lactobacillus sp.]|uniref:CopY/TcrY family copper transport repressor n=1 Tax=Lactobacillus sp. TaxID=1591 RepID=UPI003EF21915
MSEKDCQISSSEWQAMRIVWSLGEVTSSQVVDQLEQKYGWSASTTKTLLRRLVEKDYLEVARTGHRFSYKAKLSEEEGMYQNLKAELSTMCDMHKGAVLLRLLDEIPLSQGDLSLLAAKLEEKKQTAPETVPCNCLAACHPAMEEMTMKAEK